MEGNCRKKEEKREDNGLRAKSTKTRIETNMQHRGSKTNFGFKSKIHQNKD